MPGQHVTNEYLLRIVVLLNVLGSGLRVMKSEWWKNYWELWIVPVVLMAMLLFIETLHTYEHQHGNAHGQQEVCEKEY